MKRAWSDAEISEQWHLFPRERDLLVNKHGTTRLGFALLLKFFQLEGRFPASIKEIPRAVVPFVASQVEASPEDLDGYPWDGATIKRHRAEIREWCGFREIKGSDLEQLRNWLLEEPGLRWLPEDQLEEALLHHCKALQIEPPTPSHAQRILQSALHAHENRFCEQVFQALSRETVARLEALLVPTKGNPEDAEGPDWTPWQAIKSEPGKAGVASMKEAIARLRLVREVGLPEDLFKGIPPKALEGYARRAAVEEPHELRRHGGPLKATLLAAYLQRRGETLTDHLVDLLIETFHKMAKRAEKKVEAELVGTAQLVRGKTQVIRRVARAVVDDAEGRIQDVILPVAGLRWWESVLEEAEWEGEGFRTNVRTTMHRAFKAHYRRILPELLGTLEFRCANPSTQPVMQALHVVKAHLGGKGPCYPKDVKAPWTLPKIGIGLLSKTRPLPSPAYPLIGSALQNRPPWQPWVHSRPSGMLGEPGGRPWLGTVPAECAASGSIPMPGSGIGSTPVACQAANRNGTGGPAPNGTPGIPATTSTRG